MEAADAPAKMLAFLLPDMRGGGAERVALTLIRYLVERGHPIDLILLQAEGELLKLVPGQVHIVDLNVRKMREAVRPLARYLRMARPAAMQASMWPVTLVAILARLLSRVPCRLVVSEHSNVTEQFPGEDRRLRRIGRSIRWLYPLADARVCVSRDVAVDLASLSGLPLSSFEVVYNPVEPHARRGADEVEARWTGKERRILNVATLKPQKNHRLLLEAFAILHKRGPANLLILGEGELRHELESVADNLGISDAVSMPGFALDPGPYYASADVFALSSDFEGFGNVLVEALAAGLPVVSTDCRSGPSEILDHGRFGLLTPVRDADALAGALERALSEPLDTDRLRARAAEFRPEIAGERYLELMLANAV